MVLAVDAGHHMKKNKVAFYMLLTILGGAVFVGSQAWEWYNFIKGEFGAVETKGGRILQFVDASTGKQIALEEFVKKVPSDRIQHTGKEGIWFEGEPKLYKYTVDQVVASFYTHKEIL
ncbi:cytochrome c oxidase subunit III, partial [Elysia marginata]